MNEQITAFTSTAAAAVFIALSPPALAGEFKLTSFETDSGLEVYGAASAVSVTGLDMGYAGKMEASAPEFTFGVGLEDSPVSVEISMMPNAETSNIAQSAQDQTSFNELSFSYLASSLILEPFSGPYGSPFFRGGFVGAEYRLDSTFKGSYGDVEYESSTSYAEVDYGPMYGIGWAGTALDGALGYRVELRKAEVFEQKPDLTSITLSYNF